MRREFLQDANHFIVFDGIEREVELSDRIKLLWRQEANQTVAKRAYQLEAIRRRDRHSHDQFVRCPTLDCVEGCNHRCAGRDAIVGENNRASGDRRLGSNGAEQLLPPGDLTKLELALLLDIGGLDFKDIGGTKVDLTIFTNSANRELRLTCSGLSSDQRQPWGNESAKDCRKLRYQSYDLGASRTRQWSR